jgi:hypothetical protein
MYSLPHISTNFPEFASKLTVIFMKIKFSCFVFSFWSLAYRSAAKKQKKRTTRAGLVTCLTVFAIQRCIDLGNQRFVFVPFNRVTPLICSWNVRVLTLFYRNFFYQLIVVVILKSTQICNSQPTIFNRSQLYLPDDNQSFFRFFLT